jgi:hypothetical protein
MPLNDNLESIPRISRGHVLLVSPLTFSYHLTIANTLRSLGYAVTWWDDRASTATWYKLALRIFPKSTSRWFERTFLDKLDQLDPNLITHVLVIKGEGLSLRVATKIRQTLASASMGLYLWDGVDNVKGVFNILPVFDSVATFDPVDAETFGWIYRPLFGRTISPSKGFAAPDEFDWCFIGTIHSDRHRVIHRLRQRGGEHAKTFVFAYFQSPLILLMRRLLDWTLWIAPKDTLSTAPLPASEVAKKVESSRAVLDVEHPRQRGYTMRTIETLLVQKKLVTTNKHILSSNLYNASRVHVIDRNCPDIPAEFLKEPYLAVPDYLRNYYSCEGWISELLELQESSRNKLKHSPLGPEKGLREKVV